MKILHWTGKKGDVGTSRVSVYTLTKTDRSVLEYLETCKFFIVQQQQQSKRGDKKS